MSQHQHQHQHQHHIEHSADQSVNPIVAKLQAIAKPRVWGPIGVISLVSVFVWQVSENPDLYKADPAPETSASGLSPEEMAIAAEIDSSELLMQELRNNTTSGFNLFTNPIQGGEDVFQDVPRPSTRSNQNSQTSTPSASASESELESVSDSLPQPFSPETDTNPFNPTTSPWQNPLNNSPSSSGLFGLGNPTNQYNNPTVNNNQQTLTNSGLPQTPLQAAMGEYFPAPGTQSQNQEEPNTQGIINSLTVTGTATNATPSQSVNTDNNTASGIPLPASAPSIQLPEATWVVPRNLAPINGTNTQAPNAVPNLHQTNHSLPQPLPQNQQPGIVPAPVLAPNPANPYGQYHYTGTNPFERNQQTTQNSGFSNFQPTTPNPNNYVVSPNNLNQNNQNQVIQQQTPFSAPRTTPGRVIGGGRINSFSNP